MIEFTLGAAIGAAIGFFIGIRKECLVNEACHQELIGALKALVATRPNNLGYKYINDEWTAASAAVQKWDVTL